MADNTKFDVDDYIVLLEAAYMADNMKKLKTKLRAALEAAYMADNRKLSAKTACEQRFDGAFSALNHAF